MEKRRKISASALVVLIVLLLPTFKFQAVKAQFTTIYIRADGSIDPPTAPIHRTGDFYSLVNNIYQSIVVQRDNIVVDGVGYMLQGTGVSDSKGIDLTGRNNVTIKNIKIEAFWYGIYLYRSFNNSISENNIANNHVGIDLKLSSDYNSMSGNNITVNNWCGICLSEFSSHNSISENNIANNEYGVHISGFSNYNSMSGNNITNNGVGIALWGSEYNSISENNIANNDVGIDLYSSDYNSISENNITANNWCGIDFQYSSNNKFYHNNFIDNKVQSQSYASSGFLWDDGYPSGGNYWSDYKGKDEKSGPKQDQPGSDGIGDTPYVIDENNRDHYPLMKPFQPAERTMIQLKILDGERWHTAKVPFKDVDEATDYIDNFEKNNKPSLDFGSLPLNLEICNIGGRTAENVVCDAIISGIAAMIHLSSKSIYEDKKVLHPFEYTISKTIGRVEKGTTKAKLDIPVKYMCIIAGELVIDKGSDWFEPVKIDVLFTILELNIRLRLSGTNFRPIESETKLFAYGNPEQLLDVIIEAMKQRVEHHKIEALKKLLEVHIGVLSSGIKTITIPVETQRFDTSINVEPGTSKITIATIIPKGLTLASLVVTLKEAMSGISTTLSISSSSLEGIGILIFDVTKLLPKRVLGIDISLTLKQEAPYTARAMIAANQSNAILIMTNIVLPETFEVSWKGKSYSIAIASNATISNFEFNEQGAISFDTTGYSEQTHFYKITIPSEIMDENFEVLFNGYQVKDFELIKNTTHSFLHFTYDFSEENYKVTIVPEFEQSILIVLAILALFVVRIKKKYNQSQFPFFSFFSVIYIH